jgi:hypothetical protein
VKLSLAPGSSFPISSPPLSRVRPHNQPSGVPRRLWIEIYAPKGFWLGCQVPSADP